MKNATYLWCISVYLCAGHIAYLHMWHWPESLSWPLYVKLTKSLASRPKSLPCKVVDILVDISAANRAIDDI